VTLSTGDLQPNFSTSDAEAMGITDQIATYTTGYPNASSAGITNIHLAADLVNDSLIAPGATWSFNDTTGECTADKGFKVATGIADGQYVDSVGGGVCQVATTVFNAVFDAGYPIVERYNHALYESKYPEGRDATVAWPTYDFKWQNDSQNWILLQTSYDSDTVTVTLWGTDPGYTVQTSSSGRMPGQSFTVTQQPDPTLPVGQTVVQTQGVDGWIIWITRDVYDKNGDFLREAKFRSEYGPINEVDRVGTMPVDNNPAPAGDAGTTTGDDSSSGNASQVSSGSTGSNDASGGDGSNTGDTDSGSAGVTTQAVSSAGTMQ
jgi:vancomycin resistance protein YoaR